MAGPAERGDALEPRLVDAGRGQRLGEPPRLGDAERLEALEQLVLGIGGVERVERGAARGPLDRLARAARRALAASLALDPGLDEAAERRADDVERLGHLRGRAAGGGGRVVELVREPGGHRAERRQPLAVLLDRR